MTKLADAATESSAAQDATSEMRGLFEKNRAGKRKGIYSVCSANPFVLEAACAQAAHDSSPLLIEATCNQVNQDGGYTGLTPAQFRDYVYAIADRAAFPRHKLILGGDHLGPNPWKKLPAAAAMEKACAMVEAYAAAGFTKIHLDASMSCAGDPIALSDEEIATRAVRLCKAAEAAVKDAAIKPVYVIGTEVPVPGGAQEEMEIEVTTTASLSKTLDVHRQSFSSNELEDAWTRVIGVVVQPGVEFGDEAIADYVASKATALPAFILKQDTIVFEAHSTDYQTATALSELVRDHFGILKVGPELTFMMREAVFALARIEEEWIPAKDSSNIRAVIDRVMLDQPENWKAYYHGDQDQLRFARSYSLSDRIRYYWPNAAIEKALAALIENLQRKPAPMPLIAQYLPLQAAAVRSGDIPNDPAEMIRHKVRETLARYSGACGLSSGE